MGKSAKRDDHIVARLIIFFFFFCGKITVKLETKFKIVLTF